MLLEDGGRAGPALKIQITESFQAIEVQPHVERPDALAEHANEVLAVRIVAEDRLAFIAPDRDMVHGPFILDSQRAGHGHRTPAEHWPRNR